MQLVSSEQLLYRNLAWSSKEASLLASTLRLCQALRSLDMSRNKIGDEGVAEIMNALTECPQLDRVLFHTNAVGDAGAKHIADALPRLTNLAMLDLSFNLIGNAGALAFIDRFGENHAAHPALEEMNLTGNDLGSSTKRQLRTAAQAKQGDKFKFYV